MTKNKACAQNAPIFIRKTYVLQQHHIDAIEAEGRDMSQRQEGRHVSDSEALRHLLNRTEPPKRPGKRKRSIRKSS